MKYDIGEVETIDESALTTQVPRYQIARPRSHCMPDDYRVKVVGFGQNFMPGVLCGTSTPFNYRAPELVLDSQLSPSADIWSLGCTV